MQIATFIKTSYTNAKYYILKNNFCQEIGESIWS